MNNIKKQQKSKKLLNKLKNKLTLAKCSKNKKAFKTQIVAH